MCDRADARSKEGIVVSVRRTGVVCTLGGCSVVGNFDLAFKGCKTAWVKTGALADFGFAY